MKKGLLTILNLITTLTVIGQCSMTFTTINSIWCNCTGYLLASPTGAAPFNYQWSTGDTINYIDSLCQGTYTLTMTDSLGCIVIDSVTITNAQPPMTINLTSTAASCATCCDACIYVTVIGGCPPFLLNWTPYDPYWPNPCGGCAGITYNVVVIDNCGCTNPVQDSITPDTIAVGIIGHNVQNNISYKIIDNALSFSIPIIDLKIFNMLGNIVFNYTGKEITKIDMFDLKIGLYIIKAQSMTGQKLTEKIEIIK